MEVTDVLIKMMIAIVVIVFIILLIMSAYTQGKNPILNATGLLTWK